MSLHVRRFMLARSQKPFVLVEPRSDYLPANKVHHLAASALVSLSEYYFIELFAPQG